MNGRGRMREIVVISGKGGTGKTSVAAALASVMQNIVIADCDVDAADLHLLAAPRVRRQGGFYGNRKAFLNGDLCEHSGMCYAKCPFDAVVIESTGDDGKCVYAINSFACDGCGICAHFCPAGAIELKEVVNGTWYISETRFGTLVHAKLEPGEDNSGMLVTLLREKARRIAKEEGNNTVLIDGSPGIGCPVISSLTGASFALIIAEPTISGLHDFKRIAELVRQFSIPAAVCVNKYDLNPDSTVEIETAAQGMNIGVLTKIPFDRTVIDALVQGKTILEFNDGPAGAAMREVARGVKEYLTMRE